MHVDPPVLSPIRQPPVVAPLGRDFAVPCGHSVEANPWPSFRWKYNGTDIHSSTFEATVGERGFLLLKNVKYDHSGLYTCIARNKVGTSNTTFNLIVRGES